MIWLIKGIILGAGLSILVGPILFALVQAGVERGFRAGLMVGLGIWISDLLFILGSYWGMNWLETITRWDGFQPTLAAAGGIVLIIIGLGTYLSKPPKLSDNISLARTYGKLFIKGFLINTLNPFTVFFWLSMVTTIVLPNELDNLLSTIFFSGILGTLVVLNSLQVFGAKKVRHFLTPDNISMIRKISGIGLLLFGVILMVRGIFY